ncbi:MAG: MCE family protein [Planctomycetes bacterium]|nr:MCE family protein [Planctomycetota bacterium]
MNSEIKVGILFFIGLGLLLWFTIFVTQIGSSRGEYAIRFPRVEKLKEGDQVTYNGVRIGTISEVAPILGPDGNPMVRINFTVQPDRQPMVLIDGNSRFSITQGLLGGSAMDISSRSGRPITPEALNQHIGQEPVGIDEVFASVKSLIDENRQNIKETIVTAKIALDSFGKASDEIKGLVADNRKQVGDAITNFSLMSERIAKLVEDNRESIAATVTRFEEMSKQIRDLVEENRVAIKKAADKLPEFVDNVAAAAKTIDETVTENREDLRKTVANLADATAKFDRVGDNLDVITTQIAAGKGTIGKLVFEDTLHDKAVNAVDSFSDRLEEVKPVTSGFSDFKFYLAAAGGSNADSGVTTYGAYLRLEPKPWKYYEAGVSYRTEPEDRDPLAEDQDKLNIDFTLLLGWRFFPDDESQKYRLSVGLGLIETKLGGVIEVPVIGDLSLRVMARAKDNEREVNDRRYEEGDVLVRGVATYRLWKRVYLQAGADDIVDKPGFWGGIRIEILDNDLRNLSAVSAISP